MIIGHPQLQPQQQQQQPQQQKQLQQTPQAFSTPLTSTPSRFQMQNKFNPVSSTGNSTSNTSFANASLNSNLKSPNFSNKPNFTSNNSKTTQPCQQQHNTIASPLAPLNQQNFRNQAVNLLNCTNNFILNNDCSQVYIETGYTECPFHLKRTEWYAILFVFLFSSSSSS